MGLNLIRVCILCNMFVSILHNFVNKLQKGGKHTKHLWESALKIQKIFAK